MQEDGGKFASILALPYIFGLTFRGPYEQTKLKMDFSFLQMKLKIGPLSPPQVNVKLGGD